MKVTFIGTGTSQGIPVIGCNCKVCKSNFPKDKRLRSSVLITLPETNILIDTSIDFRQQMLRAGVKQLDAVLYTHEHKDHTAGLDDIRAYNFLQHKPMDIYAEERVIRALKREFPYVFAERKYPGIPQVNAIPIKEDEFTINKIKVIPIRVWHNRLSILGFRIKKFAYITDASIIPEKEKSKLTNLEYLVIGAIHREKHYSHFSLYEALDEIKKIKPQKALITHIGHLMGKHEEVVKELPVNVTLAYDGLEISVS